MAEEDKTPKKVKSPEEGFFRRYIRNPLATVVNYIAPARLARWKYWKTKVYTPEIKLRPLYRILASRLEKLKTLETRWDNIEVELKPAITKIYMDIGQYYSDECIKQERLSIRYGNYRTGHKTTMDDVVLDKTKDYESKEYKPYKDDIREITILGKKYQVPSPKPMYIYFPDREMHKLRVYGYHKRAEWEVIYSKFLKDVCEDILKRHKEIEAQGVDKKEIEETLTFVRETFEDKIKYIFDFIVEELGVTHYAKIWGGATGDGKPAAGACGARVQELQQMKSDIMSTRPYTTKLKEKSDIKYDHTYEIIKPIPTEEEIENLKKYMEDVEKIQVDDDVTPKKVYDEAMRRAKKRINELDQLKKDLRDGFHGERGGERVDIVGIKEGNFEKRPEEFDYGLDERGMPLEVDEDGSVLLDKWEGRAVRKVPKEFITTLDFLDIICDIHNEWDPYRDDLRDARYHPNSLTAVDYIMAAYPKKGFWKGRKDRNMKRGYYEDGGYGEYTMKLRKEWLDLKEIKGIRSPDNLNPAFDHKSGDKWQYIGRKYYYDPVDGVFDASKNVKEGVLTSRGISNYLIWRVVFMGGGMKKFQEAREVLSKIRGEMKREGYDTGPRMVGWDYNADPFNITTIDKLNKGLPPEAKE